jgi:ABC-type multidrug transport system fused ATPase/permease subunit
MHFLLICFPYAFFYFLDFHSLKAARELHDRMAERVLHSTLGWFESTPTGRLINRFSQDISAIDTFVMMKLQVWLICCGRIVHVLYMHCICIMWEVRERNDEE